MNGKRVVKKRIYKKRTVKKVGKRPLVASKAIVSTMRKVAKQVIMKAAETKHTGVDEVEYAFPNSSSTLQPCVNLANCFTMSQGTGDGLRIGNKINCTKANLNMIIRRNNTTSSQFPCELHVWIGHLRQSRNENPDAFLNQIYQDGSSVLPWNGSMLRTIRKTNKDLFTIYKKMVFKIGGATSTSTQFNNNDFPILQRKTISLKPLLGTITYGDDGGASNFDKDLWMWMSYVYIDDTIDNLAVSPGLKPVDFLYFVDTEYKDF